jgi:ADP-ribose pyrophosphatase YjhB (NUDIX family)
MYGRPKVEIGVYLINDSKTKILLGKNILDPYWKLVSGKLKYSEDFEESARKNLIEQINIEIERDRLNFLGSFNSIDREHNLHNIDINYYVVLTENEEKEIQSQNMNSYQGWKWFSYEDIQTKSKEIFCGIVNLLKKNSIRSIQQILTISSN